MLFGDRSSDSESTRDDASGIEARRVEEVDDLPIRCVDRRVTTIVIAQSSDFDDPWRNNQKIDQTIIENDSIGRITDESRSKKE